MAKKYEIIEKFKGCVVGTIPPTYTREEGGRFVLDDNLSQKDLGYLYEVVKHEAIIKNDGKQEDADTGNGN